MKQIIFDFGDVFLDLNYEKAKASFAALGFTEWTEEMKAINQQYEKGLVTEDFFLTSLLQLSQSAALVNLDAVKTAWNSLLGPIPEYRIVFLEELIKKYPVYLLSNTDATHIHHVMSTYPKNLIDRFFACFTKVFYSFEMHQRKPDTEIYQTVLQQINAQANETLFVDDKLENIQSAQQLGIQTWHLQVGKEDVVDLFQKFPQL